MKNEAIQCGDSTLNFPRFLLWLRQVSMRKLLFVYFSFVVLPVSAQSPAPFLPDAHTVALWHLNEAGGSFVQDTSLFGNNGTAYGTLVVPGRFGNARFFDGMTDYVYIPDPLNGSLDFGANRSFTLDVWFQTTDDTGWLFRKGLAPTPGYALVIKGGYVQGELGNREDSRYPDTLVRIQSQRRYNDGRWHVATLERDRAARKIRLYVDDTLATTPYDDPITFPLSSERPLTFGKWENNVQPQHYKGFIDEVRVSNIARHAVLRDTVALWHFDELSGTTVYDSSTYGNDGLAYGTAIVPGVRGNARSFSGTYSYVAVQSPAGLNFDTSHSFTVEAWFKTTQGDTGEIVRRGLAPVPGFALRILEGKVQGIIGNREDSRFPDTLLRITSVHNYNDGQWHKATLIRDRSVRKLFLYVDGVLATSPLNDPVTFPLWNARPLTMGCWENFVQPTFFRGVIDEVRIVKRAEHPSVARDIDVTPLHLDFGRVAIGSFSDLPLTIRNMGATDTLRVTQLAVSNSSFLCLDNPFVLPPGGVRQIHVRYLPAAVQRDTGVLSILSNDPDEPVVHVSLVGRGIRPGDAPTIQSVRDVPDDQGKQVRIIWYPSFHDRDGDSLQIVEYAIWRRVGLNDSLWDFVATIPAVRFSQYSFVAPTLYDSTRLWGIRWSVFKVSAHTRNNVRVFFSEPDSGYSVDNLPPTYPTRLTLFASTGAVRLEWNAPPDPDVAGYWIYRSNVPHFLPTESNLIGSSVVNRFTDPNIQGSNRWYYRIAAFDSAGNQGPCSEEAEAIIDATFERPTEFFLYQNFPNPFNPSTTIRFDVPAASHLSIRVLDLLGREVAVLADGMYQAGRHEVTWNAQGVSSGVYVYRMQAAGFVQNKKVVLLK